MRTVLDVIPNGQKPFEMFVNVKLDKEDKKLILENVATFLDEFNQFGQFQVITNLIKSNAMYDLMIQALDKGIMNTWFFINRVLNEDWIYYQNQKEAKKMFELLSTYETDELNLTENRGYLPDVIVETPKIIRQVSKNWEFIQQSAQRIFIMMLQNEQYPGLTSFMNSYPAFEIDDYYDGVEMFLINIHEKTKVKKFLDRWSDVNEHFSEIRDEMDTLIVRMDAENLKRVLKILIKDDLTLSLMFKNVVDAFADANMVHPYPGVKVLELFLDFKQLDYTYRNAYMLKVFYGDEKIRLKMLQNPEMVDILIKNNDIDFLPDEIKDVFVF